MFHFIIASILGSVCALFGYVLGSTIADSLWLALPLSGVGFLAGFGLWEKLVSWSGASGDHLAES